jgi:F0F1-type ATP synthase delta subunit
MKKQSRTKLAQIIADRTLKDGVNKQLSTEIAAYLLAEGRTKELDSIVRDVQADWAAAGHVDVIATSAHPLTAPIKATIVKQVQQLYPAASEIVITEAYDPEVIGGVRLTLPNQQLDLSIEAKLNRFKQLTTAGKEN